MRNTGSKTYRKPMMVTNIVGRVEAGERNNGVRRSNVTVIAAHLNAVKSVQSKPDTYE